LAYAATIFLSAFLLFEVQLIIGKYILPFFGGAAAVWILCLLFFQVLLLVGDTYAHVVSRLPRLPSQGKTHAGVLLGCLVVFVTFWARWETPLTPGLEWMPRPDTNPVWKIFELLAITVALPFLILSTTGPLLQSWHSRCYPDKTPYSLYALSNAGSLLGVLCYPFLVEWTLTTHHQASVWSICFAFFVLLSGAIALQLPRNSSPVATPASALPDSACAPKPRSYLMWFALSTCSSVMLLATTNFLCQDIAIVQALCDFYHLHAVEVQDTNALWVLASQNPAMLRLPHLAEHAPPVVLLRKPVLWTDDYSNLFAVLQKPKPGAKSLH
jgi:hypothetical protein